MSESYLNKDIHKFSHAYLTTLGNYCIYQVFLHLLSKERITWDYRLRICLIWKYFETILQFKNIFFHSNIFYCSYIYTIGLQTSFANLRAAHLTYNNRLYTYTFVDNHMTIYDNSGIYVTPWEDSKSRPLFPHFYTLETLLVQVLVPTDYIDPKEYLCYTFVHVCTEYVLTSKSQHYPVPCNQKFRTKLKQTEALVKHWNIKTLWFIVNYTKSSSAF